MVGYRTASNVIMLLFSPQKIKEELCWRAHATEVVDLFIEEEKNVIATASIDGSVRYKMTNTSYCYGKSVELSSKFLFLMHLYIG